VDGFVVAYDDEALLVEKIVFLMQNESHRILMAQKAVQKAASFSVHKVMARWEALFKALKH